MPFNLAAAFSRAMQPQDFVAFRQIVKLAPRISLSLPQSQLQSQIAEQGRRFPSFDLRVVKPATRTAINRPNRCPVKSRSIQDI
jgi:hypothetical protein